MSILKVARIAHPILRSPAEPVPKSLFRNPVFQKLIENMRETMYEYEGVGLAAPQVHEGLRLAVIEVAGDDERSPAEVPFVVLANPVVTPIGDETSSAYEGCLSIPDLRGAVPRFKKVKLEAQDRHGKPYTLEAEDFFARVIQHECDHLDGRVYLDRMESMRTLTFIKEFEDHVRRNEEPRSPGAKAKS
jgi:peptide deformylase